MAPATLVFDLDDTLLDERPGRRAGRAAMERVVREALPDLDVAAWNAAYDRERRWFWSDPERHRRGRLDLLEARREVAARALSGIGAADGDLALRAARGFVEAHEAAMVFMPDARGVLRAVRERGARLVLLTNGAAAAQARKLDRFRLAGLFDHVQIEGAHGVGKPCAEAFAAALDAVGAEPGEATMVGNDWRFDVVGALRAGLGAVWVDVEGTGRPPGRPPRPHRTIRALRELVPVLERDGVFA